MWRSRRAEALLAALVCGVTSLQREDGGWSLARLLADNEKVRTGVHADAAPSDGYGTEFATFALRKAGIAADDAQLRRAIHWLKANQRESGRWFTRSLVGRKANLISNSATAWAVMALESCGEIMPPQR